MEVNIYEKFKVLFRRIFQEEFQISRYYSEKLLRCLEDPNDNIGKHVLGTPMFSDLIFNSIRTNQKLSIQNKIFLIDVVTVLFKNELQFNKLQCQGFNMCFLKNCVVDNLNSEMPSGEFHLAFIKLTTALVSHCSGMKLIISKKLWERALHPGLHRKPAHVSKAVYEYLSKLVWRLDEFEDETSLYEVLRAILKPIHQSEYQTLEVFDGEKEKFYSEPVIAPLHALLTIMSETSRLTQSKCIVPILKHCYFVEAPMPKLITGTRDPDIIYLIAHINFKFHFTMASKAAIRACRSESDFLNEVIVCFVNAITMLLTKKPMIAPIQELIITINIFWAKSGSKIYPSTFERNGQKYEIEDQFLYHLMLPMMTYVIANVRATREEMEEYCTKTGQMLTEHITKSGYRYKTMLERHDLKKITIHNVKQLFRMKGLLKTKQAGTLYQGLFYLLQTFILKEDISVNFGGTVLPENPRQTSDDVKLLSLTLAAIKMLLTEHNINWYENLEIICIQNGLMDLLKQNTLPNKSGKNVQCLFSGSTIEARETRTRLELFMKFQQVLQVLDLIELSTKKFLSPDMTLLVENQHGGALSELMALMPRFLQHQDWEVRDSALSMLLACTDIAFVKYMPLQKLIIQNQLIVIASNAALSDAEYYVQATALKCVAAATRIESVWREVQHSNANICKQLFYILQHNPEGMVRMEAAHLLTQVYINQNTSKVFKNCMHEVMATAALEDLHWEVQIAALKFWKHVIKNHFNDRGMIDGKFPKVTFSKEKRKIIVLNENEVKRQLASIMNDLSANGCLTVISECIKEEFNIEVMKLAHCMSNELIEVLTCHNFDRVPENDYSHPMDHSDASSEPEMDAALDLSFVPDTIAKRGKVIDDIMNTNTSDLIINLDNEKVTGNSEHENIEQDVPVPAPRRERVHPNKFLEDFKRTDYVTKINNVENWKLEPPNLEGLLDEILGDTNLKMSDYCIE